MIKIQKPYIPEEYNLYNFDIDSSYYEGILFEGISLPSSKSYDTCKFHSVECSSQDLDHVIFSNCIFESCDFSNSQFHSCGFHQCEFVDCKMVGFSMIECSLRNCRFQGCEQKYSNINSCNIYQTLFIKDNLEKLSFEMNKIKELHFQECNLQEWYIYQSPLKGTDLRTNDISGIQTQITDIKKVIVSPYQAIELAKLLDVKIQDEE